MTHSGSRSNPIPFPRDRHNARDGVKKVPEPHSLPLPPHNLPASLTPFIGRYEQVQEVCSLLIDENVRLLLLTGPGGVGKTRLAIRVAEEVLPEFEDGACFVALASVADPELVIPTIAQALGVKDEPGKSASERLKQHLHDLGLLLILDNFEQVTGAAWEVASILASAPGVRVIVTTRVPLHLYGEHEYAVPTMMLPDSEGDSPSLAALGSYEAIQLFVARAQAIRPDFSLTSANAKVVADICRRLDGLPLALELAAARLRLFSPQALLARLGRSLPLLVGGPADAPTRHETLRNTIAWSYNLLDPAEQRIFAVASVFMGGFTLDAVQQVCVSIGLETGRLVDQLESLIAQNLLRQREQKDGEPRFSMLMTIREYALEKLAEDEQNDGQLSHAQRASAQFFLEMAEASREAFAKGASTDWLPRLDVEYDNMRAALRWSLDQGEREMALRMATALDWFWHTRGYLVEGTRWLEEALALGGGVPDLLRAKALYSAGWLTQSQNDYARTRVFAEECLSLYRALGDRVGTAKILSHLGVVAAEQEDYSLALSLFEQSLAVWRELENANNVALLVGNLCFLALYKGDYERAVSYGEESLTIQRARGDSLGSIGPGINLGLALLHARNYARGVALLEECRAGAEEMGSKRDVALSHNYLGLVALLQGDHNAAAPHYKESLALSEELGNRFGVARSLVGLAGVAVGEGQMRQATLLSGAAHALISAVRVKLVPAERELNEGTLKMARAQLGDANFTKAWEQGQAMTQAQSIGFVLRNEIPEFSLPSVQESPSNVPLEPAIQSTDELSSREVAVISLVAAGLTNKEIGERLMLSHRTVEAHLYSIFNKLNVTTRSAATRYAMEKGLAREGTSQT